MTAKKAAAKAAPEVATKDETPAKPVESPQVSENNETSPPPGDVEASTRKSKKLSVKQVGEDLDAGSRRWGTGRDRDTNLASEGYNLEEVRQAVEDARRKRLTGD